MHLNLTLNGILVASAKLDPARCKDEYYLQAMRRLLLQQNSDVLALVPAKQDWYIEVPPSSAYSLFTDKQWHLETGNNCAKRKACTNCYKPYKDFSRLN